MNAEPDEVVRARAILKDRHAYASNNVAEAKGLLRGWELRAGNIRDGEIDELRRALLGAVSWITATRKYLPADSEENYKKILGSINESWKKAFDCGDTVPLSDETIKQ